MQRIKDRIASTTVVSTAGIDKSFSVSITDKPLLTVERTSDNVKKDIAVKPVIGENVDVSRYQRQSDEAPSFVDNSIMEHILISDMNDHAAPQEVKIDTVAPKTKESTAVTANPRPVVNKPQPLNLSAKPVKVVPASSNISSQPVNSSKLPQPNKFKITPSNTAAALTSTYQFKKPVVAHSTSNAVKIKVNPPASMQKPSGVVDEARRLKLANMQKSIDGAAAASKADNVKPVSIVPSPTVQDQPVNEVKGKDSGSRENSNQSIATMLPNEEVMIPEILTDDESSDDDNAEQQQKQYENNKFNVPEWARSPNLKQTLRNQTKVNPDTIFGSFSTLRLEDIFQGSSLKRFRVRSSSANWSKDELTQSETKRYDNYMGYQS